MNQLANGQQAVSLEPGSDMAFALIIDGKSLAYALEDDMKERFLQLAVKCASVICCRVSPKQKALVLSCLLQPTIFSHIINKKLPIGTTIND